MELRVTGTAQLVHLGAKGIERDATQQAAGFATDAVLWRGFHHTLVPHLAWKLLLEKVMD
jgi:hypothetical protein